MEPSTRRDSPRADAICGALSRRPVLRGLAAAVLLVSAVDDTAAGPTAAAAPATGPTAAAAPATGPTAAAAPATPAPTAATPAPAPVPAEVADAELLRLLGEQPGETIEVVDRAPPGAHAALDREALERTEHDDVHKLLAAVAGVYLRTEDGYGLRPNIGMRGAAAERSAKVALYEDGVPIAPAPYSAPAAYFFPVVTRLSRIEVLKGPAAVAFGPNTVGGAVELMGEPMPDARAAYVDLAGGTDRYGKLHARAAETGALGGLTWSAMGEYVKLRSDGFKQLDGGGPTGFDKADAQAWLRVGTADGARRPQRLDLRVGLSSEDANETYVGLTDADFARSPLRRYAATADDLLRWRHRRLRIDHRVELGPRARLQLTAYRHDLERAWTKLEGFWGRRSLGGVLADPMAADNARWYALLTGAADTAGPDEEVLLATGDRRYLSQGLQATVGAELAAGPTYHLLDAGVRLHVDRVDRLRTEEGRAMVGGALAPGRAPAVAQDDRLETLALAMHARDVVRLGRVELTAGARVEAISAGKADRMDPAADVDNAYAVFVPGGGVTVDVLDNLQVLAGVHRGFSPPSPEAGSDGRPEASVNWEAGARWRGAHVALDAVGFFSDYANLTGTCTLSAGCTAAQEGEAFDGGRVHVWGAEAQLAAELTAGPVRVPVRAAYTFTRAAFRTAFSSSFGQWGDVEVGDELPYLPAHQLAVTTSLDERRTRRWAIGGGLRWQAAVRDVAGQGAPAPGERTEASLAIDLDAHLRLGAAELYATCANLLDEHVVAARRPAGARPGSPRTVVVGIKARY